MADESLSPPEEIWKPVVGFPAYEVSSWGQIRSLRRGIVLKGNLKRNKSGRPECTSICLYAAGGEFHRSVHRLVLDAFVGPCPTGMEGCHNDGDPSNNRVENLRWDTHVNNMRDMKAHGTHAILAPAQFQRGEKHRRAVLTEETVRIIKAARRRGVARRALARRFGVSVAAVGDVLRGRTWRHVE